DGHVTGVQTCALPICAVGLFLFHGKRSGAIVLTLLVAALAVMPIVAWSPLAPLTAIGASPRLTSVVALFATIGAFTFGGGLSMRSEERRVGKECGARW